MNKYERKICGIYCITCKINNKKLIGQSVDIYRRWYGDGSHVRFLTKNKHYNKHLQRAWNKYREENFEFTIIEECSEEDLNEKEVYWISYYDTFRDKTKGFNMTPGGEGSRGDSNPGHKRKGKTNKEIYGEEKALKIAKKLSNSISGEKHPNFGKQSCLKGKTYEEIMGEEKAKEVKKQKSIIFKDKYKNKTYEEIMKDPEKIKERKQKQSERRKGKNNLNYIEVSKEIQDEICKLYLEGKTKKDLKKLFNLPIDRILKENNIHIRNVSETRILLFKIKKLLRR